MPEADGFGDASATLKPGFEAGRGFVGTFLEVVFRLAVGAYEPHAGESVEDGSHAGGAGEVFVEIFGAVHALQIVLPIVGLQMGFGFMSKCLGLLERPAGGNPGVHEHRVGRVD